MIAVERGQASRATSGPSRRLALTASFVEGQLRDWTTGRLVGFALKETVVFNIVLVGFGIETLKLLQTRLSQNAWGGGGGGIPDWDVEVRERSADCVLGSGR